MTGLIHILLSLVPFALGASLLLQPVLAQNLSKFQSGEIDTLYYFNPDSLEECAIVGDVGDLAVYFAVSAEWNGYDIIELHLLASNNMEVPQEGLLYISSASDSTGPGEVIDTVSFSFEDSTDLFPNWKIIDLSSYSSLTGLKGIFWVTGIALFNGLCDFSSSSGHSIWYSILFQEWSVGGDLPVRAVVRRNEIVGIEKEYKINVNVPSGFTNKNNFPNPFNASTTLQIHIPAKYRNQLKTFYILDIKGRLIYSFPMANIRSGSYRFQWNGLDASGNSLPSGLYIAVLQTGTEVVSRKILLVK